MNYSGIAIELSTYCPLHCAHCCQEGHNEDGKRDPIDILETIDKLSEDKHIFQISFTGGEPFMDIEKLYLSIKKAKEKKFYVSVISSGFWATDDVNTQTVIRHLKQLGLDLLCISRDSFHCSEVSNEKILRILRWARNYDLLLNLQICTLKNTDIGSILNPLKEQLLANQVEFYPIFCAGRGKTKIDKDLFIRSESIYNQYCGKGSTYLIDIYGDIYPCCSPLGKEPFFKIGNIKNKTALQIRDSLKNNKILNILRNYGFNPFVEYAKKNMGLIFPEKIVSSCDLCELLFTEERTISFLSGYAELVDIIKRGEKDFG